MIIWIPGKPIPQGSKNAFVNPRTGKAVMVEAAKGFKEWRKIVADTAREAVGPDWVLLDEPLEMIAEFYLEPPAKSKWPDRPAGKPDCSKLIRAVEDSLTGVVYRDDSLIVTSHIEKHWGEPGVRITIVTIR